MIPLLWRRPPNFCAALLSFQARKWPFGPPPKEKLVTLQSLASVSSPEAHLRGFQPPERFCWEGLPGCQKLQVPQDSTSLFAHRRQAKRGAFNGFPDDQALWLTPLGSAWRRCNHPKRLSNDSSDPALCWLSHEISSVQLAHRRR